MCIYALPCTMLNITPKRKKEWKNTPVPCPGAVSAVPQNTTPLVALSKQFFFLCLRFLSQKLCSSTSFPKKFFLFLSSDIVSSWCRKLLLCLWLEPEWENSVSSSTFCAFSWNDTNVSAKNIWPVLLRPFKLTLLLAVFSFFSLCKMVTLNMLLLN